MSYFRRTTNPPICMICGKDFDGDPNENICPDCRAMNPSPKKTDKKEAVKDYIREHQGASEMDVIKNVGVSKKFLKQMADAGDFGEEQRSNLYPCQRCGKLITRGVYCHSCFLAMRTNAKSRSERDTVLRKDVSEKRTENTLNSSVLVIDPDDVNLGITKFILNKEFPGHQILTSNSLLNTMNILRNNSVSLILLDDTVSSAFDGLEILRRVRSENQLKDTPVIMMSAKTVKETLAVAFSLGISDYLIKPCEPTELSSRVGKILSLKLLNRLDEKKATSTARTEETPEKVYKILLIDDKPSDLQREEEILKDKLSCEIVTARSGIDGLYLLNGDSEIDLILVSMNMAFMDALEFLTFMENDEKLRRFPAVVMTDGGGWRSRGKINESIAKGTVDKPNFNKEGLDLIKDILQRKR